MCCPNMGNDYDEGSHAENQEISANGPEVCMPSRNSESGSQMRPQGMVRADNSMQVNTYV
jgi:hypothetical protein